MALVIVVASIAIRAIYFQQLNATPLISLHAVAETDMHYFDGWARKIAGGDWRSEAVGLPMHPWHRDIAREYFASHPEAQAAMARVAADAGLGADADAGLWLGWSGGPGAFVQDPLYPYLVALTYRVAGADVRWVFVWQMALGVLSNLLIWWIASRTFGEVAGAVAAGLAVLCAPLVYYDLLLLRETTIVFASLALTWLIGRAFASDRWPRFVVLGVALGLAFLLKSTFVLAIVAVAVAVVVSYRRRWRHGLVVSLAIAGGFAIGTAPLVARNLSIGRPPLSMASAGGLTFINANEPNYPEELGNIIDSPYAARLMADTGGATLPSVIATLREHTVSTFLTLMWHKWDRLWHWYEIPNNENIYYVERHAPVLRWLPVTFWILSPFALIGLVLGVRQRVRAWPLYLLVVCSALPMLIFYVIGRFRAPLVAMLIPFAALAMVTLVRWSRSKQYGRALAMAAAVLASLIWWTGRPASPLQPLIRPDDWKLPYLIAYLPEVKAAERTRDIPRAIAAFEGTFRSEPEPDQLRVPGGQATADLFGRMHRDYAALLQASGRAGEARAQLDVADRFFQVAAAK